MIFFGRWTWRSGVAPERHPSASQNHQRFLLRAAWAAFMMSMNPRLVKTIGCLLLGGILTAQAGCALRGPLPTAAPAPPVIAPTISDGQAFEAAERLAREHPDKAVDAYEGFILTFPASPLVGEALMRLGGRYRDRGDMGDAIGSWRRILADFRQSPLAGRAALEILSTYFQEGDFERLVAEAEGFPQDIFGAAQQPKVLEMLADSYLALGRPVDAAAAAVRAWETAPEARRPGLIEKTRLALGSLAPEAVPALLGRPMSDEARRLLDALCQDVVYDHHLLGCMLPLTGPYETYGRRAFNGIELALDQFANRPEAPSVRVRVEDTGSADQRAAPAVENLALARVAAIIGPMATAGPAATEAQIRHIPIVAFTQRDQIPTIGDFVFRHFITPRMQVEALVHWAVARQAMTRFAVLYPAEKYGQTFKDHFEEVVRAYGGEIACSVSYDPSQTDFADQVKQLIGLHYPVPAARKAALAAAHGPRHGPEPRPVSPPPSDWATVPRYVDVRQLSGSGSRSGPGPEKKPPILDFDALFIPDAPSKAGLIIPQLAYHDVTDRVLMGTNLWQSQKLLDMARPYVEGAVFPTGFFAADPAPTVADFVARFKVAYGQAPGFIEAVAYDTTMMLLEIISRPAVRSRTQVRDGLRHGVFPAAVSGATRFSADGEPHKALRLITIEQGQFLLHDVVSPADGPP